MNNLINESFLITKKFKNAQEFSYFIEEYCVNKKLNYMDAIIDFCQKESIEIESIGPLITKSLKEKIRAEAISQNFMKSKGTLEL